MKFAQCTTIKCPVKNLPRPHTCRNLAIFIAAFWYQNNLAMLTIEYWTYKIHIRWSFAFPWPSLWTWSNHNYAAQDLKAKEPSCEEYLRTQFANARLFVTPFSYLTVCLRLRNLPMKAAPHTKLPEIRPFSITQYWLLIIIVIPCLLVLVFPWCAAYSGVKLVCDEVKFRKDGVKIQIWGKPAIFLSWAMSVHNEIRALSTAQHQLVIGWSRSD